MQLEIIYKKLEEMMNWILKLDINEIVIYTMYIVLIWQCRHIIFGISRGLWDVYFGDDEEYK